MSYLKPTTKKSLHSGYIVYSGILTSKPVRISCNQFRKVKTFIVTHLHNYTYYTRNCVDISISNSTIYSFWMYFYEASKYGLICLA